MRWFFLVVFTLSGCTTAGYLTEQGWGQLKLQWQGVNNDQVLADPNISPEIKFKIRLVEDAKKYFNHYFFHDELNIYRKTTFLKGKAVTWLVVASRPDEISAYEHHFPFLGSFPYLGFFEKDDAEAFAHRLQRQELVTWIRPVFAYSTLGYLSDRILSSFFEYDEVELTELIFHEMFHTLFFVKDNVDLNENLASFFADKLLSEYYRDNPLLVRYRREQKERQLLEEKLVRLAKELKNEFAKMKPNLSVERAHAHTQRFVTELLLPVVRETCEQQQWSGDDCPDRPERWNQARLAALLTYEAEQDFLASLYERQAVSLRDFYRQLKKWHKTWKKGDRESDFTTFLGKK